MARSPRDRLTRELGRVEDELDTDTADAVRDFAKTLDRAGKAPRTTGQYVACLRRFDEAGVDLLDCTAADINAVTDGLYDDGKGLSTNTLIGYVSAAVAFFDHYPDLGVDSDDIDRYQPDKTPRHDEGDMFSEDEVFALRRACGGTRNPARNRAFLELLLFTGQRIRALLTLRADDVDLSGGAIHLNPAVDGLKGALRRGRHRPVFGARKYLREWVEARPDAYRGASTGPWLFIGDPSNPNTVIGDHWSENSAGGQLERIAAVAGVEKPCNAHNFRHYTVTVLRRDYDRDWEQIGSLLGLKKGSDIAKTTYSHIDDNKLRRSLEESMGYAEPEPTNRFAPPVCPTCKAVLKPNWRMCPECYETFGPKDASLGDVLSEEAMASDDPTRRWVSELVRREMERVGHG